MTSRTESTVPKIDANDDSNANGQASPSMTDQNSEVTTPAASGVATAPPPVEAQVDPNASIDDNTNQPSSTGISAPPAPTVTTSLPGTGIAAPSANTFGVIAEQTINLRAQHVCMLGMDTGQRDDSGRPILSANAAIVSSMLMSAATFPSTVPGQGVAREVRVAFMGHWDGEELSTPAHKLAAVEVQIGTLRNNGTTESYTFLAKGGILLGAKGVHLKPADWQVMDGTDSDPDASSVGVLQSTIIDTLNHVTSKSEWYSAIPAADRDRLQTILTSIRKDENALAAERARGGVRQAAAPTGAGGVRETVSQRFASLRAQTAQATGAPAAQPAIAQVE